VRRWLGTQHHAEIWVHGEYILGEEVQSTEIRRTANNELVRRRSKRADDNVAVVVNGSKIGRRLGETRILSKGGCDTEHDVVLDFGAHEECPSVPFERGWIGMTHDAHGTLAVQLLLDGSAGLRAAARTSAAARC